MRNIFRSFMRFLGASREAEETAPASFLPESAEIREETPDGRELTPEDQNTRFLSEVTNHSIHLSELAGSQAQAGDIEGAIETARGIGSALFYASALRDIAIAQARAGHISEAIETIRRIDDPDAGWKGRGVWATYGAAATWHIEGGRGVKPGMLKFQVRPDPLAD